MMKAVKILADTCVNITTEGHKYFGGVIGRDEFETNYSIQIVETIGRIKQINTLAEIAMCENIHKRNKS